MESIEEKLIENLQEKFGQRARITDSLASIGVDSIGMAELTVDVEKNFNVKVDDEIVHVETVQELVDYIRERQSSSAN